MDTRAMFRITRRMVLGLAAVALAAVATARPARAATIPWIKGQTFELNTVPEHVHTVKLYFSWQDAAGNLIVEATHQGKPKVIGTGKITQNLFGYMSITFGYTLAGAKYSYSGSIRQWGGPAPTSQASWFMAGSYSVQQSFQTYIMIAGPLPFCADASYIPPPR